MLTASSGVHIVLDGHFSPPDTGLLIPQTDDGRVLFLVAVARVHALRDDGQPRRYRSRILRRAKTTLTYLLTRTWAATSTFRRPEDDILATWSGLRPLVSDPKAADTAKAFARSRGQYQQTQGLVTVAGGKWTTYRKMALDTVDEAVQSRSFAGRPVTD